MENRLQADKEYVPDLDKCIGDLALFELQRLLTWVSSPVVTLIRVMLCQRSV
jgi:hypothetical protein